MKSGRWWLGACALALGCGAVSGASAQDADGSTEAVATLPDVNGPTTEADARDFDKYFFFHRDGTDEATALADIRECDVLAFGLRKGQAASTYAYVPYQYGVAGAAAGGLVGALIQGAMAGAAARSTQRVSRRRCMGYKGYDRYGLAKDVWKTFNFEDGLSAESPKVRERAIAIQAKIASGAKPATPVLGR